jgi:NADPH2:quinone reductase
MDGAIKALALDGFDESPSVIDIPALRPGPDEVLVRVHAASVNAYDAVVAMGLMKDYLPYVFPSVIGQDLAGVVESVGAGVEGFAAGDRVFGTVGVKDAVRDGSFGELAPAQASKLARTPERLGDEQAGSLGVAGTTAQSAIDATDPKDGSVVLIVGATGGVGTFAIQLAAARGARVIASIRPGDEDFVKDLGATETADYTDDLAAEIRTRYPDGIDALVDLVNRDPAAFASLAALVRPGGVAVSALGGAGEASDLGGVRVANVSSDPAHLRPLADRVAQGTLRVAIRRTYPLADAAQALTDFTQEHTLGKLVITVP